MLKHERIRLMEELVAKKGFVSMEELCQTFSISMNTVRSDVRDLVQKGSAQKTYGGISCVQVAQYSSYEMRELENVSKKEAIARAAAQMVHNGDIIYVDVGTTCIPLMRYIPEDYHITLITNNLSAITQAASNPNIHIMTFGGTYQPKSNSFKCTFPALHSYLNSLNISCAFLSVTGISSSGALTNSENFGREVRSGLLARCPKCYLLADSSKFGKTALLTYGTLADVSACFTDSDIPASYQKLCKDMGTRVVIVDTHQQAE